MTDVVADLPIVEAVAFLFVVVMLRANATYWIGRGVLGGVGRSRLAHHLDRPTMLRAQRFMARWGLLAIPLSFLTIGVQTAVNATAGFTRVPLSRYLPAVTVGALMWAVLYATVGLAALYAALALAVRSPWALVAVVVLVGLVVARAALRRGDRPSAVTAAD